MANHPKTRDDVMRDTLDHVARVRQLVQNVSFDLIKRAGDHDRSKFSEEEFPLFAEATPALHRLTYGSPEYRAALKSIKPAVDHHYEWNRHHPEWHKGGIHDMTLADLIEMLADWKAATERHDDGDLVLSIVQNGKRFGYDRTFATMLINTAKFYGWITHGQANQFEEEWDKAFNQFISTNATQG